MKNNIPKPPKIRIIKEGYNKTFWMSLLFGLIYALILLLISLPIILCLPKDKPVKIEQPYYE
jgi:Na+-driven multidrug efflux pump